MTEISLSKSSYGSVGIVGHADCGHSNSHLGFIQDDSGGLSCVIRLLQKTFNLNLAITSVEAKVGLDNAYFEVKTAGGGIGRAYARRGITAAEARLAQYVVDKQAVCSQALAADAFGRILGQGAMEVPVALQTAIANASMDSFAKSFPDQFELCDENLEGNCGKILGTVIKIDDIDVSVMALSNATIGGIGPNEDIEGNVNLYGKKDLMAKLHLDRIPSIVVEGKVCAKPLSPIIDKPTFLIRAYPDDDNPVVAQCLEKAAEILGYPAVYRNELLARSKTAMRDLTKEQGKYIQELGIKLSEASSAREKVEIAAELNRFASSDLGGITFMSEDVHQVMGGVGCIPGSSCVLSLFIPDAQLKAEVLPNLTIEDTDRYSNLCVEGLKLLAKDLDSAKAHMNEVMTKYEINLS